MDQEKKNPGRIGVEWSKEELQTLLFSYTPHPAPSFFRSLFYQIEDDDKGWK